MKATRKFLAVLLGILIVMSSLAVSSTAIAANDAPIAVAEQDVGEGEGEEEAPSSADWTVGDWINALLDMVNFGSIFKTLVESFSTIAPMLENLMANLINMWAKA